MTAPAATRMAGHLRRVHRWTRRYPRLAAVLATMVFVPALGLTSIAGEAVLRARLPSAESRAPTRLYARPFVLEPGRHLDDAALEGALRRLGYRRVRGSVGTGQYAHTGSAWVIGRRPFRVGERVEPGIAIRIQMDWWGNRVGGLYDGEGRWLSNAALEPEPIGAIYGGVREDRIPVSLADVSPQLVDAVLSIEDRRFFEHGGIDLVRIAGAFAADVRAGRLSQGGSTLTQQLAKNLYLSPARTVVRKLRETAIALVLEHRYRKEQILEAYLNEIYLGQDGGVAVHGVGSGARFYFGKDVGQLDLAECALLAALIRGPNLYSPFRHPDAAVQRRALVLGAMRDRGVIGQREFAEANTAPLGLRRPDSGRPIARYFADYVASELRARYGHDALSRGLTVITTLDARLQEAAEEAVTHGLARLERDNPRLRRKSSPVQAALVALDPHTGAILAMVGGRDYTASQFNRAVDAHRQPGSSFKPIVALSALARPRDDPAAEPVFTLASVLEDAPLSVETPAGTWRPVNYDRQYRGRVTLREALERSLNVPFARLGLAVGPGRIVGTARRLGIESPLQAVPSLALGASEVTPVEMARAYGVLAAGGYRAPLNFASSVLDARGTTIASLADDGEQAYDPAETYLVTSALRGAVERGTGRGLRTYGYRGAVAAKSGTTNGFRDGWYIGYTPTIAVAVWVGFDDGQDLGLPGSRLALPIFARFLSAAVGPDGEGEFDRPWDLDVVEVNPETGLRAGPGCRGDAEVFLPGTAPERSCSPFWDGLEQWDRRLRISERAAPLLRELIRLLERGEH
jgi:penicillin-binding protein 1B